MQVYKTRKIAFKEVLAINDWQIKVYTIAKNGDFNHDEFYENVKKEIPKWLRMSNSFNDNNEQIGFLILHAGTEGIFSLMNWWVGENMLNTHIFMTQYDTPSSFTKISGDGLAPCIWEIEVIHHEKNAWVNHVLKQYSNPNFQGYLDSTYNGII